MRKPTLSIDTSIHEVLLGDSPCGVRCTQGNPGIFLCSQDPAEIIPNVFIGSVDVAKDVDRLSQHGIQAVVNASKVMYTLPSSISRIQVEVDDTPTVNLACHFHKTSQFIQQQVEQGDKNSLREAYLHTRSRKPNVHPNLGFFRQLQGWEQEITGQSTMPLAEYYQVVFSSFGFSKPEIQNAVQQVGTEDYHAIVEFLHARNSTPCSCSASGSHAPDLAPPPSPMPSSMQTTPLTTPLSSAAASNVSSKCMYATNTNQ